MKFDLALSPPLLNAPGTLGFAPRGRGPAPLDKLGAFVTNPISLEPRTPAHGTRCLPYAGGFLMHTGHPNPGLRMAIKRFAPAWKRSPRPLLVHLLAQTADEVAYMAPRLEGLPGVSGFELGLPPDVSPAQAVAMTRALMGGRPVVVRLPLERAAELAQALLPLLQDDMHTLAAFSLSAPRGALPAPDGALITGRLYGPAVFPLTLAAVRLLAKLPLPVIAGAGVYTAAQAQTLRQAGAVAVQVDAVFWRNWDLPA
jgi:dihydroorotate dehydrogenase (NAD+) catalytic subunit